MAVDDSFKKPGAIPFKWEIRPGVPKSQQPQPQSIHSRLAPSDHQVDEKQQQQTPTGANHSFLDTPRKLRPPPAGFYSLSPMQPERQSFRSEPRTRSGRVLARAELVSAVGCFPSPLARKRNEKKRIHRPKPGPQSDSDCSSDLETLPRWSVSTRKSLSPFRDSPLSPSFSSYQSSPRAMSDAEWAGFGLF